MMDVTNEQLLIDIENATKEAAAYKKLYEGYEDLLVLPECKNNRIYNHRTELYKNIYYKCCSKLRRLNNEKEDRGL